MVETPQCRWTQLTMRTQLHCPSRDTWMLSMAGPLCTSYPWSQQTAKSHSNSIQGQPTNCPFKTLMLTQNSKNPPLLLQTSFVNLSTISVRPSFSAYIPLAPDSHTRLSDRNFLPPSKPPRFPDCRALTHPPNSSKPSSEKSFSSPDQ